MLIQHVKDIPLFGGNTRWSPVPRLTTAAAEAPGAEGTTGDPTKLEAVDESAATATVPADPTNEAGDPACGTRFGMKILPKPEEKYSWIKLLNTFL